MVRLEKGSALIIVDVQNDFMPGGALAVPDGDKIISQINRYIERFKGHNIFATCDWHPENHISFQQRGGPWPPHCIQNTEGAKFHKDLKLPENTNIIKKASDPDKDAYSGFEGTELASKLKDLGVNTLFICGVATEYCVKNTVLDALKNGFKTYLLTDAIRGINEADSQKAIEEMKQAGAETLEIKDIEPTEKADKVMEKAKEIIKEVTEQVMKDVSREIRKKSIKISKDIKKIVKKSKKDIKKFLSKKKGVKEADFVAETIRKVVDSLKGKKVSKERGKISPRGLTRGKTKNKKGGGKTMATTKKGSAKAKQKAKSKKAKK